MFLRFALFVLLLLPATSMAQSLLKGVIRDERNIPIPSAKIYVKNNAELRSLADANGYYEMWLYPDEYFLVFEASGYELREVYVTINDQPVVKDVILFPLKLQDIEDVSVSVKKTNPGRDIIMKVVENKDRISPWSYPHTVHAYIKASEKVDRKEKKNKNEENDTEGIEDPFLEQKQADTKLANDMNLVEVDLTKHFGGGNKVKEVRNAFEQRGDKRNYLYYTTTVKSEFNFFDNLMQWEDLHQSPVTSPISTPGILSYKYRLEEQYEENGKRISKIKIIPRSTSNSTLSGYIYVIDTLWLIQKLELELNKGNLLVYDHFKIYQEFEHPGDSICLLSTQTMEYGVKFSDLAAEGKTVARFDSYNFKPNFPAKYFNNELSATEKEAYDKDSLYWNDSRKVELTEEERRFIKIRDSIADYQNRKEYLDSVDADFNKVTILKVLWWGVDHRNRDKQTQWTINSLAGLIRPIYIAGPRVSPGFFYFKKWKNEQALDSYTEVSYGFLNQDIKGSTNWDFRYDPFHSGTVKARFSHDFGVVRTYDAISQIYKRDNFFEQTLLGLAHRYELVNGLYFDTETEYTERRSLKGYKFWGEVDSILPNNDPTEFQTYQAFVLDLTLKYIPGQKYMREPNRKVILGSKWPTFYINYEKGINGVFGSDVNHDYIAGGILHTFKIGTIGTSSYHIKSGLFLNSIGLKEPDRKFQRRSDPLWFSNPLYSFQGLNNNLPTEEISYEAHFVHHDDGAIINKIPFMKKTRIGLVFGGGALYVPEFDWEHYEIFAGLERNFKFSKRRLRIGIYGVVSDGNQIKTATDWKVSFAILNNRSLKWNF